LVRNLFAHVPSTPFEASIAGGDLLVELMEFHFEVLVEGLLESREGRNPHPLPNIPIVSNAGIL